MKLQPMVRGALVLAFAAALLTAAACARSVNGDPSEPVLIDPDAATVPQGLCVQTECPQPFATCDGVAGLCTVNLQNDVAHCGGCNSPCPKATSMTHGSYLCSDSQCHIACLPLFADCNGSASDGCEVGTEKDPDNCGFCGNKCDAGDPCWKGACGCPSGFSICDNTCVDLKSDNSNCGACGDLCGPPESPTDPKWICGPSVTPANTKWTCSDGSCDLKCKPTFGDCNTNFCGDGCEIDLLNDPNNCGTCGHACNPGQWCNQGACACPEGTIRCNDECVDIQKDPLNCGGCNFRCPGPGPSRKRVSTGSPSCENGECKYTCFPGWADCDGVLSNGCEANLLTDQNHCGNCTTKCNVAAGQPCVGGVCLTRECDGGVIVR